MKGEVVTEPSTGRHWRVESDPAYDTAQGFVVLARRGNWDCWGNFEATGAIETLRLDGLMTS